MRYINSGTELKCKPFQNTLLNILAQKAYDSCVYISNASLSDGEIYDVVITDSCIMFAQFISIDNIDSFRMLLPKITALANTKYESVYSKLSMHRGLTFNDNSEINVKMPFVIKFIFDEISFSDIVSMDESLLSFCFFKAQEDLLLHTAATPGVKEYAQYPYQEGFTSISEEEKNLITFILAPEYGGAIPNDYCYAKVERLIAVNKTFEYIYRIKNGDIYANAFCLDTEQIDIVNKISQGHWLIVSPAGSGKSVLLLSTAMRVSKSSSDKTLIVCRNRNLSNIYEWKIAQSGVRRRNIQCFNVYRLCQHILSLAGVAYDPKEFDVNFEKALKVLESGMLDLSYDAVFIDEIQILREKYYKIFGYLIKNAGIVCLYGDIEQDININMINRTYPWEITGQLNFGDNIIKLDKNYRNTKNISQYSDSLLELSKFYYEKLNIQKDVFIKDYSGGIAFKEGHDPVILYGSINLEAAQVIKIINGLKDTTALSEIAVLFVNRQNQRQGYYLLNSLREELSKNKINYTELISSESIVAGKIGSEKGVVLATVESVPGLDFKVVILCGLSMLGVFENSKKLTLESIESPEKCKLEFYKSCNILYMAVTRAREQLFILLTEPKEQSVYSKLLYNAMTLKKRKEASIDEAQ